MLLCVICYKFFECIDILSHNTGNCITILNFQEERDTK